MHKHTFSEEPYYGERGPKWKFVMSVLASLFMRNALPTHDTSRCTTTTCVSILKYLQAFFAFEMGRSAQELFAIEKMAAQGMSIKQITEAVFASSTEMADRIVPLKDAAQKHVI